MLQLNLSTASENLPRKIKEKTGMDSEFSFTTGYLSPIPQETHKRQKNE